MARIPFASMVPPMAQASGMGMQDPMSPDDAVMQQPETPGDPLLEALVAMGAIPEEQALLMRQANQGQAMFQTPGAEGMRVGGTYKAAHPLEHLSVLLQRGVGARKEAGAEDAYRETLKRQSAGRGQLGSRVIALLDELRKRGMGGEPPTLGPAGWGSIP